MRTWNRLLLGFLIVFLAISPAMAAPQRATPLDELDAFIETYMANNRIPGVSLAIAQGDEIVYSKGYGTAGSNRPMNADTPMFIGSQTKSFTAAAVMQLVEAGKLELDAPVQRYISWFKVADPRASAEITVRNLLNHTSGLSETGYVPNLPDNATMEEAVRNLQYARPTAKPGEKEQYFNPGYVTLGYLVEEVSGQNYGDYLRQNIFEPLDMRHSSANLEEYPGMNIAQGYTQLFSFPVPMPQTVARFYLPAGFIVSTADDLARFLMVMGNGGQLEGRRILSSSSIQAMFTPNSSIGSVKGFGWDISSYYGEPQITHGGATERFYTSVVILPESGLSVAMLTNQDHMFKATYDYLPLFWGVVDILTGHPVTKHGVSGVTLGLFLLGVFLVILFFLGRGLLALPKQRERLAGLQGRRRWLSLLPHGIAIGVTLVLVTVVGPAQAGRGFDLRWFIGFYPDVAILAGVVLATETVQLLYKAGVILALRFYGARRKTQVSGVA